MGGFGNLQGMMNPYNMGGMGQGQGAAGSMRLMQYMNMLKSMSGGQNVMQAAMGSGLLGPMGQIVGGSGSGAGAGGIGSMLGAKGGAGAGAAGAGAAGAGAAGAAGAAGGAGSILSTLLALL